MFALTLATLFNAGFSIVVRTSQRRGLDLLTVGWFNYVGAAAFYGIWLLATGALTCDPRPRPVRPAARRARHAYVS